MTHDVVFEVFARKSRGEPLRHIGYLDAPDAELARVYAWNTYDEENWFEMCVVPRSAIIPVNRADGPFAAGTGEGVPAGAALGVRP
jgi:1,2-phenylacetyl-CoA epoxidase PaaB subunit